MSAKRTIGVATTVLVALGSMIVLASRPAPPHLTMTMVSLTRDGEQVEGVIGLTNSGGTVAYRGYSKDSPIYTYVHDTPAGPLTNGPGWCGMGMSDRTLSPNGGVQFKVWFPATNAPTRILVNYRESRLFERLLARAPGFIRAKLPRPEWRSAEVGLAGS